MAKSEVWSNISSQGAQGPAGPPGPAGAYGPPGPTGSPGTGGLAQQITVSAPDITNGYVILASAPADTSRVRLDVAHGCIQKNGVDYTVTGVQLIWAGYGLATIIAAGDVLVVEY